MLEHQIVFYNFLCTWAGGGGGGGGGRRGCCSEEAMGLIPTVTDRSLLVGSVSV